jgi:hypothetical protein
LQCGNKKIGKKHIFRLNSKKFRKIHQNLKTKKTKKKSLVRRRVKSINIKMYIIEKWQYQRAFLYLKVRAVLVPNRPYTFPLHKGFLSIIL